MFNPYPVKVENWVNP